MNVPLSHYYCELRGFVKLKQFQKSEKNSEVGGWVKPQLGFIGNIVFFCVVFVVVHVSRKKKLDRRVGVWGMDNPSFSRIFGIFLT